MKKINIYQSDDGIVTITPNFSEDGALNFITIYGTRENRERRININNSTINELIDLLKAVLEDNNIKP